MVPLQTVLFRVKVSVWGPSSLLNSTEHPVEASRSPPWSMTGQQSFLASGPPTITEGSSRGPTRFKRPYLFPQLCMWRRKGRGQQDELQPRVNFASVQGWHPTPSAPGSDAAQNLPPNLTTKPGFLWFSAHFIIFFN